MAFPMILLAGVNISLIIFIRLFQKLQFKISYFFPKVAVQYLILLVIFAAIVSVFDANSSNNSATNRGLIVLPNYIYWGLSLLLFTNLRKYIDFENVVKYIFFGFILSTVYYGIQPFIPSSGLFLNKMSPNSFSFILICFCAPGLYYIHSRNKYLGIIILVIIASILLLLGRRAGFVLTMTSTLGAIYLRRFNLKYVFVAIFAGTLLYVVGQTKVLKDFVLETSPRIHELIYENDNLLTEDRSYLVRRLMLEKALLIAEEHPITGIGLNNFDDYQVAFEGNFEGAKYVINKRAMNEKSAHNSYASILAEGGLLLFIPLILLLLYNIWCFFKYFNLRTPAQNAIMWGFMAMCIHLYFISAILNVYAWFIIGMATCISLSKTQFVQLKQKSKYVH